MTTYYFRIERTMIDPITQIPFPPKYKIKKLISYTAVHGMTLGRAYEEAKKHARDLDARIYISSVYCATWDEYESALSGQKVEVEAK